MVEKMKFLSITGPKEQFDRVMDEYLSKYDIHLENALSELKTVSNLRPFSEVNPYKDALAKINDYLNRIGATEESIRLLSDTDTEEILKTLDELSESLTQLELQRKELLDQRQIYATCEEKLHPYRGLELALGDILNFDFIKYQFGRISTQYYENFANYLYQNTDTLFYKCDETSDYVWGVYFVPITMKEQIDAIYSSLHFETINLEEFIPKDIDSQHMFSSVAEKLQAIDNQLDEVQNTIEYKIRLHKNFLLYAKSRLEVLSSHFEVRKLAACTREDQKVYFILCGWMTKKDAAALIEETNTDDDITIVYEDDATDEFNPAPTKLKNPRIFKPFQMYIRMYGLPAQNELDPTIFVALTYSFLFGWMFGDVGQGALLAIGGFLLYKWKHMDLAAIVGSAGIFSILFGFLFGSIFGFEDVLPALWLRPIEKMSTLPFIGKLNTVFVVAIAFGMCLNLLVMIFNIINHIKAGKKEEAILDHNGLVGFIFYAALFAVIVLFMSGHSVPGAVVLVLLFGLPLLLIALKEPICNVLKKKKPLEEGAGMFVVQTFFELFEVLLSYFSNTLSFVRVGAFAVSHAAMMEVVLMLAGATDGSPNWIVVIIGNLFVCLLEGLIVGIQVLRLEYYELFSRFYKGTGREFKPYRGANHTTNK